MSFVHAEIDPRRIALDVGNDRGSIFLVIPSLDFLGDIEGRPCQATVQTVDACAYLDHDGLRHRHTSTDDTEVDFHRTIDCLTGRSIGVVVVVGLSGAGNAKTREDADTV